MSAHLMSIDGVFWRMMFTDWADAVLAPARSPEGRSHYNGQPALYLSATPEGCVVASKRYMSADDPERAIYPIHVVSDRIIDLRDPVATAYHDIDVTHRAAEWQSIRAKGLRSPTWDISDRVRDLGFHGMLYASRSDPSKTHLTLFNWNTDTGAKTTASGPDQPWSPPA